MTNLDSISRCPSADEWIRKLWYIYTMEYYSAIKKNTFESVLTDFLKRKLDRVYVILSLSGDTSLFASTPCIPSTFPFRRLCSPLPTPHSAYKSFPLRITWLVPPFHWGLSRSLAHAAKCLFCFLYPSTLIWFSSELSSLTWYILLYIYLFLWSLFPLLESETSVRGLLSAFFLLFSFFLCMQHCDSDWHIVDT